MTLTRKKLLELQKAYDKAVEVGADIFIFDGTELVTSYAKYLIEVAQQRLS